MWRRSKSSGCNIRRDANEQLKEIRKKIVEISEDDLKGYMGDVQN